MTVYIVLLVYIFALSVIFNLTKLSKNKKTVWFVFLAFLGVFLVYSLRAPTVGIDIPGYKINYEASQLVGWGEKIIHFEKGFIILMQLFSKNGADFQLFLTVCNLIILYPICVFIYKYSRQPLISSLVYICFSFFVFNLTGLRQALATSIMLIGIMLLLEDKKGAIVKYALLVYLATFLHTGAYIGFFYIPLHFIKEKAAYYSTLLLGGVVVMGARGFLLRYVREFFEKDSIDISSQTMYFGNYMIFMLFLAVIVILAGIVDVKEKFEEKQELLAVESKRSAILEKFFFLGLIAYMFFGSNNASRTFLFMVQVMIVHVPNSIERLFEKNSKVVVNIIFALFLLWFFYGSLKAGTYNITPYSFHWE